MNQPTDYEFSASNAWRPIATAPFDGSTHLIFCPEKKEVLSAYFHLGEWFHSYTNTRVRIILDGWSPSHWMPLPPFPSNPS